VKNEEDIFINQTNLPEIIKDVNFENNQSNGPKLFSKNPNKNNKIENEEDEDDLLDKEDSENKIFINPNETEEDQEDLDRDDSNVERSIEKSNVIQNFNVQIY